MKLLLDFWELGLILGFQIFGVESPHSALSQIDASSFLKEALVKNLRGQVSLHYGTIDPYIGSEFHICFLKSMGSPKPF